jgi:hypothetical protein
MNKYILTFILPVFLLAQSTQQIQKELNEAQAQYEHAKELFNPWYSGPLLTGSAHMMPPGYLSLQPYLFVADNYAVFDGDYESHGIPDFTSLNPQINALQAGITSWLDIALGIQGVCNWQDGKYSGGFGDTAVTLGFPLLTEGLYIPAMKIGIQETFPTGRYQKLTPGKGAVQGIGMGSYQTTFSYRIAKLCFWSTLHPLNLRSTFAYTIPTTVHVKGFNSYGGGFDTKGKVRPGNQLSVSVGMEWSVTQRWVFANDIVYAHHDRTQFNGHKGVTSSGKPAKTGAPSSEQWSLAPAIEYNFSSMLGVLGGVWFSFAGRNSSKFVQGIVSVTYTWKVH